MSQGVLDDGSGFAPEPDELDQYCTVNTEGMTAESLQSGNFVNVEGNYHWLVADYKLNAEEKKTPTLEIDCQVQDAPYPTKEQCDMVGKVYKHKIYLASVDKDKDGNFLGMKPPKEGSVKMALRFALGLKLIEPDQIGQPNLKIPWKLCKGRQFCASIKGRKDDYTDKDGNKVEKIKYEIPFGESYPVDAEEVADWPKDLQAVAMANAMDAAIGGGDGLDDLC